MISEFFMHFAKVGPVGWK